jgi:hypothetical protein
MADERHPTALGHKYMADLAAALIQRAFLDLLMDPHQPQGALAGVWGRVHASGCVMCVCACVWGGEGVCGGSKRQGVAGAGRHWEGLEAEAMC